MPRLSATGRTTQILMALDANLPVLAIVGYGFFRDGDPVGLLVRMPWLFLAALAFPVAFACADLYHPRRDRQQLPVLLRILAAVLPVAALAGWVCSLAGDTACAWDLSVLLALCVATGAFATRSLAALKAGRERAARSALVIGAGWAGRDVIDCAFREPRLRTRIIGLIDDDPSKRSVSYKGIPVLGPAGRLREAVVEHGVDLVIVAISHGQRAELIKCLLELKMRGVEVIDMPGFCERATGQVSIKNVEDAWFLSSGGFEYLHQPLLLGGKRLVDLGVSVLGLFLSLPLLLIVIALVKLDSRGPVFHREESAGQNENPFRLLKFRSMREDAGGGSMLAGVSDYRVTRVGRWLRLTRLDEIPQFVNVFRGEMSFIGPRPERPPQVERFKKEIPYYALRFAVKPGLTGWAQVRCRRGSSVDDAIEKLKYDLYYVKNISWRLDLQIALKTLKVAFFAPGA